MKYNVIKHENLDCILKNKLELYKYFDMIYSVLKTRDDFEYSSGFLVKSKSKDIWTVETSNKKPVKYWRPEFDKLKEKNK